MTTDQITRIAEAAHEMNRLFCEATGDFTQRHWPDAPEWQKEAAIAGVQDALGSASPEQQHIAWCNEKIAAGWKWGPEKDPEKKEHPCLVSYADLPEPERRKDALYVAVVRAMAEALA
jgi:hypothetical protein